MGISREFRNRLASRANKHIEKMVNKKLGGKSLDYVSRVVRAAIPTAGVGVIRTKVISSVAEDLQEAIERNPQATVDELIREAVNTPDYMALLKDLGMGEEHLRNMAQEALNSAKRV